MENIDELKEKLSLSVLSLSQEDSDSHLSSLTDINLEKAIQLLQEKQKESNELREALKSNIELMKQQYKTMLDWKNKISNQNTINKERYTDSVKTIQELKQRNKDLEQATQEKIHFEQKIEELVAINKNLESEISSIEKKYHEEKSRNDQLQDAIGEHGSENAVEVLVAHTEESTEKITQMEQMLEDYEDQKKNLEVTNTHLTNDVRRFKEHTDQLINDLKNMSLIKETIQLENNKLTEENLYLRHEYQVLLTKYSSKNTKTEELNSKMEDYELMPYEKLSNFWNDSFPATPVEKENQDLLKKSPSKQSENHMTGIMSQLNQERSQVDNLRVKNKALETRIQNIQDEMETKIKELKREHCENIQKLQKEHQAEIELMCINNPDRKAVESMVVDQETLKHQVMNLLSEIKEAQDLRKSAEEMMANKTSRCRQLEETNIRLQMEMDRQRKQDAELIQTLQYSIQNYESKLSTEIEQTQIKQEQNRKLRESFSQLVDDYKEMLELNHQLEQELKNNSHEKLMSQIDHLTAQLIAAEESINLKNQTIENLQEKFKKCTAENDDIPLLRAQADIYKVDFNAERAAREKEHQETQKLKEDLQNLQLQNRELLDQLEALSRDQLSEMRQRVYPRYNAGAYGRNPYGHGTTFSPDLRSSSPGYYMPSSISAAASEARQHEEEADAFACPLCTGTFPDQDSLKLHVAEHI